MEREARRGIAHQRRMAMLRRRRAHAKKVAAMRRHQAKLRRHAANKQRMMRRKKLRARLAAERRAIAKKAGLVKNPKKKPCAKKPKMIAESINMIVMRRGTTTQ